MSHRYQLLFVAIMAIGFRLTHAAEFPDFSNLPDRAEQPNPLVMQDGTRITTVQEWTDKRRPELKQLFQHYMYGFLPSKPQRAVVEQVIFTDTNFLNGKATISESRIAFYGPDLKHRLHVLLIIPNRNQGPTSTFVGMNFCGNHAIVNHPQIHLQESWVYKSCGGQVNERATEAGRGSQAIDWNIDLIIDRGYGLATFCSGDLDPDTPEFSDGIEPAFFTPGQTEPRGDDAGTIATWAWGFHRVVDFLIEHHSKAVDQKKIISLGHSRNGKTALLAAAMDERIALAIPHQAGCGGTAPSRIPVDIEKVETIKKINTNFPHWFCDNFPQFNDQPTKLPFDQHCLLAICAPRPVLYSNAIEDRWANPDGQFEMLKAATPVYQLFNVEGLDPKVTERPQPGTLVKSRLGYFLREGKHSMTREDWHAFLDFADAQLGRP